MFPKKGNFQTIPVTKMPTFKKIKIKAELKTFPIFNLSVVPYIKIFKVKYIQHENVAIQLFSFSLLTKLKSFNFLQNFHFDVDFLKGL